MLIAIIYDFNVLRREMRSIFLHPSKLLLHLTR